MIKDMRLLIEFATIAEEGSFTLAARKLGVAQPWLSAQIQKLEDQLGVRLLDRTTRQLVLTPWGKQLMEVVFPWSLHTRDVISQVASLTRQTSDSVRIGVQSGGINEAVAHIIKAAGLNNTNSDIFLEPGITESLVDRVRQGVLDFAFVIGQYDSRELEIIPICKVFFDIMLRADDALARKKTFNSADLKGRSITTFPRALNPALYDAIYGSMEAEGVKVGRFPELEVLGESNPDQWPEHYMRLSLCTAIAEPAKIPGTVRIRLMLNQDVYLDLIRLKGNVLGRTRRNIWSAAKEYQSQGV
jgi:DNA-binding transcriptional LysR family regulator